MSSLSKRILRGDFDADLSSDDDDERNNMVMRMAIGFHLMKKQRERAKQIGSTSSQRHIRRDREGGKERESDRKTTGPPVVLQAVGDTSIVIEKKATVGDSSVGSN